MNTNELTVGQVKELLALFGGGAQGASGAQGHFFEIGKNYSIRTVTMIYTGVLVDVGATEIVLTHAAWIPETARFSSFIELGEVAECEPYPEDRRVIIGRGAIVDACVIGGDLPRVRK